MVIIVKVIERIDVIIVKGERLSTLLYKKPSLKEV